MNDLKFIILIITFLASIMYYITTNLEYKGYSRVQGCYDECYDNYIKEHGSLLEQLEEKNEQALADPYSNIRGLWGGCAACHGQNGQGVGAFPSLIGKDEDYIIEALTQYRNKETRGGMSSTMWSQASILSDADIKTLADFIENELE